MKLLVSDYDGTLNFHGKVNEQDLAALNDFYNSGNIISIASSRPFESLHNEVLKFNIPYNLLCCNDGNAIFDKNKLIDINYLNNEELLILRKLLKQLPVGSRIIPCDQYGNETKQNPLYYRIVLDENYIFENFEKIFCSSGLSNDCYLNNGTIFSQRRNKGYATKFAMQKYAIALSNTYTVGDGNNDFSMLKDFNGYSFPWRSQKVKKLSIPIVGSVRDVIERMK